jgi:hypothetical protein
MGITASRAASCDNSMLWLRDHHHGRHPDSAEVVVIVADCRYEGVLQHLVNHSGNRSPRPPSASATPSFIALRSSRVPFTSKNEKLRALVCHRFMGFGIGGGPGEGFFRSRARKHCAPPHQCCSSSRIRVDSSSKKGYR